MKFLKKFSTISDANTQGAAGLHSPHVDIISGLSNVNFAKTAPDTFTCEFDNNGVLCNVVPVYPDWWKLFYTTTDSSVCMPLSTAFAPASIISNAYSTSGEILFDRDLTTIGNYAFQNCTSLATASNSNVTKIGTGAFYRCTSLTTASFPNVTEIGNCAFRSCTSLTTISFPNATKIYMGAFQTCTSLTTASFPNVTEIGDYAFQNCKLFTSLYLAGSSVAYLLNTTGFTGTPIASGTGSIYVPASLVTAYQSVTNWAVYSSQITAIPE